MTAASRADYLAVVAGALHTISSADPSRPVELGPGSTVADIMGWSARFAAAATDQLSSVALAARPPLAPAGDLAIVGPALLDALATVPMGRPCWTPSPAALPQAAFWLRRSAHALSVRAWQVQVAADVSANLPPWLLRDGIDEHLTVLLAVACTDPLAATGVIALRSIDIDAHWVLRLQPGCVPGLDDTAEPDAELVADAATLRLGLAGMLALPPGRGEPSLLAALHLR